MPERAVKVDRGLPGGFRIPHGREIEQVVPLCDTARVSDTRAISVKDTLVAASEHLDRS
jgi:hypothetical protein